MEKKQFEDMMKMENYKKINTEKFKNYTELRDYQSKDMIDPDPNAEFIIPENFQQKINELFKKTKFDGHSLTSKKNKPGNLIHKYDHIWCVIGENDERIIFLMTNKNEFTFFREFLSSEKNDYNIFLEEVSNKFANISERWKQYLK